MKTKPKFNRPFRMLDAEIYRALAVSLSLKNGSRIDIGKGLASAQKFAPRCAAEGVWNALETCGAEWDLEFYQPSPKVIYEEAKKIDGYPDHEPGTSLQAAAEAACRMIGRGIKWMVMPHDWQVMLGWLHTERTGIAFDTMWYPEDNAPGHHGTLEGGNGISGGHVIHIHGFEPEHSWRRYFFGKRRQAASFIIENSHRFPEKDFYYPASRVKPHGRAAIVFIPPTYDKL